MKPILAEVITIGDEILFGQITDTNTQWIGAELTKIGIRTVRKSSVGDTREAILAVLDEATQRADLVILTGGLGPTKDDVTKVTLCEYFNTTLERNPEALAFVTKFFESRGRQITEINARQADLPLNCTYVANDWGTAPGMWFNENGTVYVSLPGVPFEMKNLMQYRIIPMLQKHFETPVIVHKMIRTVGIGESFLAETIADWENNLPAHIKLAYLPHFGQVRLRLTGTGTDSIHLKEEIDAQVQAVLPLIQPYVFGYDDDELETVVAGLLAEKNWMLATAESCTGGFVASQITKYSGSSSYFVGGVVSYSNTVKVSQLGVKPETLAQFGAVSEQTVREMAEGVRKVLGANVGIATSGIAGPNGGTPEKPVGTIWIACSTEKQTVARLLKLGPFREQNIQQTSVYVFNLLRQTLLDEL
ncbi:nicotinamide-nucleotide amidase [Larkinella arboricola]|uniref:CinA-like protein n=1 Tax=Larkinella arboricola TaxID=643671 RepID=A0A327X4F4_LARAB|nr:competence/damage-inducible protein A [Larkinella arboricola]RAK00425.1 nicotinamide-nucleotide amidase [Larkinella arboricola]